MSEAEREVYRSFREGQTRYSYFLLAAAGAAIGLAVNQTQTVRLAWSQVPLGLAVLAWGFSFFFGCRHLLYVNSALYSNLHLFRIARGEHPLVGPNPDRIVAAREIVKAEIDKDGTTASWYGKWQFISLTIGAVLYVGWHTLEMYLRTVTRG